MLNWVETPSDARTVAAQYNAPIRTYAEGPMIAGALRKELETKAQRTVRQNAGARIARRSNTSEKSSSWLF